MVAPTLTVSTDANPAPRVLVTFSTLVTGTQTITVYRTAEGRTMKVRGGVNLYAVGGAVVMDYEAPFGVPATYQAEQFDVTGTSLGFTDQASVTLAVTDTWIHQPLSPGLAIKATMLAGTADDLLRPSPQTIVFPEGATVGIAIGGQRQGVVGGQVNVIVNSKADADTFQSMFGGYSTDFPAVLCIRTPILRLPRVLFAACSEPHELALSAVSIITYSMVITEVRPPTPGLIVPSLRRKDIDFAYATRNARAAAYATRLARDSDFSLAGVAGP